MRKTLIAAAALLAAAGAAALPAGEGPEAPPRPVEYLPGRLLCRLANRRINESSGLAPGRVNAGCFWTHNDSGDAPRLYAFNLKGEDLGTFRLEGRHVDWEDIASYRAGGKGYLVVGDIGDNPGIRPDCAIYIYGEPDLKLAGGRRPAGELPEVKLLESFRFTYEDGSHNAESLATDPTGRVIYIVSKKTGGSCKVYKLERYRDAKGAALKEKPVARAIATLSVPTTSAMDMSPDGRRAMVGTYRDAYEYTRRPGEPWARAFGRRPRRVTLPRRPKGEGLCYGPDGKTVYLTSEAGGGCPLLVVPVKGPEKKAPADG